MLQGKIVFEKKSLSFYKKKRFDSNEKSLKNAIVAEILLTIVLEPKDFKMGFDDWTF